MNKLGPLLLVTLVGGARAEAQQAWEVEALALAVFVVDGTDVGGAERFIGAGGGLAYRAAGRLRAGLWLAGGDLGGTPALRSELGITFYLNPFKRRGMTPYAGGGIAVAATGEASAEYLLVLVGVESNPGSRSGWFVETGLGGGIRVAGGVRRRWGGGRRR